MAQVTDQFSELRNAIGDAKESWRLHPAYFLAEPWDVQKRTDELIDQATADGIDLHSEEMMRCIGAGPHGFQTAYLMSKVYRRVIMASNQIGKSFVVAIEILCRATGQIPICMRYPVGHDTGIQREITAPNIHTITVVLWENEIAWASYRLAR